MEQTLTLPEDIMFEIFNNASLKELRLLAQLNTTWSYIAYEYWENRMIQENLPIFTNVYTLNEYIKIKNAIEKAELTIKEESPYMHFHFNEDQDLTQIIHSDYLPPYSNGYDISLNFERYGLGDEKMVIEDDECSEMRCNAKVFRIVHNIDINDIKPLIIEIFYYYPDINHHDSNAYHGYRK